MSYHYQITADLQVRPDIMPLRHGRNLKKADWEEFHKIVKNILLQFENPILWSPSQIEKSVAFLQNAITTGLDAVAKLTPYRPKKSIFLWWNLDQDQLRKLTCRAHDYARRNPSEERWQAYRKLCREFGTQCGQARQKSWQQFTEDQVSPKEAARLHPILQRHAYNKLGLLTKDDGTLADSQEESYQILMKEHFPGSTLLTAKDPEGMGPDPMGATGKYNHPVLVKPRSWINHESLDLALKLFGKHKCPGPDGFRPIILCNLPLSARTVLLKI
jgi:hypothetical protein